MTITVKDASEYFKGLLLLISKDRKVSDAEADLLKRIGKVLGFEKEFCDSAIQDILDNTFVVDEPALFSTSELAMKFIKDGLTLAAVDGEVHGFETTWLKAVAEKNGLDIQSVLGEKELATRGQAVSNARLEAEDLIVEYTRHNPLRDSPE
jgi:hypothetical protein